MAGPVGYEVQDANGNRAWWDGKKITPLNERGIAAKPMSSGLQKSEDEDLSVLQTANSLSDMIGGYQDKIKSNKMKLGPVENALAPVANFIGRSDESSRNYGSFRAGLEKMRNDSLRLNKGVQTEGDAQRAWNELISNLNDKEFVQQRLAEIQELNNQAARFKGQILNSRRQAQNIDPLDVRQFTQGSRRNPFDLSKGESRKTIPFGAFYKDPYGNLRRNDNYDAGNPKFDRESGAPIIDGPKGGKRGSNDGIIRYDAEGNRI